MRTRPSRSGVCHVEPLERRQLFTGIATMPYGGVLPVAGQTIEAENFDSGKTGVAYYGPGSASPANSQYRPHTNISVISAPNQDVVGGASNGYYLGNTMRSEWLDYSFAVAQAGNYRLAAGVADALSGAQFHTTFDALHSTAQVSIPQTPTSTSWHTVESSPIWLAAGNHVMRISIDRSGSGSKSAGNFDWFQLIYQAPAASFKWRPGAASTEKQFEPRAAVVDGKLYAFGGYSSVVQWGANDTFQALDPETGTWTNLGKMPIPQTHAGMAVDQSTRIVYFVGGLFGLYPGTATNQVWDYNTHTNVWTQLPSLPENLSAGSAALVDGKLHYFGGNIGQARNVDQSLHLVLDLSAGTGATWTTAAPLPEIRDHVSAVVLNGMIYLLGGEIGHDTYHLQQNHCFCYDPPTDAWARIADMPLPRSHTEASTFVLNGKIIVAGGQADDYKPTNTILEYDPAENRWSQLGNLPMPLQGTIVQAIGDELVVADGYGVGGVSERTYFCELPIGSV